ncbi:MAG: hypothetical protein ABJB03_04425 [Rhodoglobus sp.]
MSDLNIRIPDLMPELLPGRHRNARKGGCFMEFASYLAGEKWSDHPACTHAALAAMCRLVNDFSSDEGRGELTTMIPRVIGLTDADRVGFLRVVVHAATASIAVASLERQRALAVGLLSCSRLPEATDPRIAAEIRHALEGAPDCERWAQSFVASHDLAPERNFFTRGGEAIMRLAIVGLAFACVPDSDERLRSVLEFSIAEFEAMHTAAAAPVRARELLSA